MPERTKKAGNKRALTIGIVAVAAVAAGAYFTLPTFSGETKDDRVKLALSGLQKSEERRVGKECRSRWSP